MPLILCCSFQRLSKHLLYYFLILQSRSLCFTVWSHCGWKTAPPKLWSLSFLWWAVSLYQFQSLRGEDSSSPSQLPVVNCCWKVLKLKFWKIKVLENYRNKQFISFRLRATLWWNLAMSCSRAWIHPRVGRTHRESLSSPIAYQGDGHGISVRVFKPPLFYLMLASEWKSGAAGNSNMPKRSSKVLPLSEKVKVLSKERKSSYAEVANI